MRRRERLLAGSAFALALVVHLVEGLLIRSPFLLPDELTAADSQRLLERGGAEPTLHSLLFAPLWALGQSSGYAGVKVVDAVLVAAIAFPAYALARRLCGPGASLVAAAAAALVPASLAASSVLPEGAAALALVLALLAAVRAQERPSPRRLALAVLPAALAVALWPYALLAALGLVALAARPWLPLRQLLTRWPQGALSVGAVAILYPAIVAGAAWSPAFSAGLRAWQRVPGDAVSSLAALVLGMGVLPPLLALAGGIAARREPAVARLGAGTLVLAAGLLPAAGVIAAGQGRHAAELALLPLAAPAFALALAALTRRPLELAAAAAATAALLTALLRVHGSEWQAAPSLALAHALAVAPWALAAGLAGGILLLAWALGGLLPDGRRVAFLLACACFAPVLALQAAAAGEARRAAVTAPRLQSHGQRVLVVDYGGLGRGELDSLLFWNPDARLLEPDLAQRPVAAVSGRVLPASRARYAFDARGAQLQGRLLERTPLGALLEIPGSLRVAATLTGVYTDGWTGRSAVYRRFSGALRPGRVSLLLSRKYWPRPGVPNLVRVSSESLAGTTDATRSLRISSGSERSITIRVPAPPFAVRIVAQTFRPADFGQEDRRRLGVVLAIHDPAAPGPPRTAA